MRATWNPSGYTHCVLAVKTVIVADMAYVPKEANGAELADSLIVLN